MSKQIRLLFYGLIILIGILSFSTAFFFAKGRKIPLEQEKAKEEKPTVSSTEVIGQNLPSPGVSSQVTRPASIGEKPSNFNNSYTVQQGDTLFGIAQEHGLTLSEISLANGISDADSIQANQILIIPEKDQITFTVNNTQATSLQQQVDSGRLSWRLDPVETARSDAPKAFGLKVSDSYVLKSKDDNKAIVTANSENGNFSIELSQPITQGDKGIWAIELIKKV